MKEFQFVDHRVIFGVIALTAITLSGGNYIYGLSVPPANYTITTKLTDTLKSITSNVSTTIQANVDKIISDTMDIQINNALNQLSNSTIIGNTDGSVPKFETKVPSGIDIFENSEQVLHHQ